MMNERIQESDHELLELAAEAAGIEVDCWLDEDPRAVTSVGLWNPLISDADALRLAVKLDLMVTIGAARDCDGRLSLDNSDDPYAATRRAIVKAAAEIGRTMR